MTPRSLLRVSQHARNLGDTTRIISGRGTKADKLKGAAEMRAEEQARVDAAPATARCLWCPRWRHVGTVAECRAAAAEHRAEAHPEARGRRRYGSSLRVSRAKGEQGRVSARRAA